MMKANLSRPLVVLAVGLVAVAVALFGVGQRSAETQTATPKMQDLGTLGGYRAYATGINASGQVVGEADDPQHWQLFPACTNYDCQRAFLYDASATPKMQNLGTLLGDILPMGVYGSGAQDINDSGQVVGTSATRMREAAPHGFLYDTSAATPKMQDLNTLLPADPGWTIRYAMAINTEGQIAATGYKDGVGNHALLLTPTSAIPPPDDTEAPSPPTITSPQDNSYDTDGAFSISGSAEADSTVELFDGTTSKGTTKADSSSGAWSIALSSVSDGSHTYTAKTTDAASNTSSASDSVTVKVDKSAPTGSVTINDGASRTRSRSVMLTLSASDPSPGGSGVSQMRISNSGLSSASWEAYSTTTAWSLSSGQGTKTVYVQYRDGAGNLSVVVTDTIRFAR